MGCADVGKMKNIRHVVGADVWLVGGEDRDQDNVEHEGCYGDDRPYDAEYDYVYAFVVKSKSFAMIQKPLNAEIEDVFAKGLNIIAVPTSFKNLFGNQCKGQNEEQFDALH